MENSDVYHALTLWFAAIILIQTSGTTTHPLFTVASLVALLVTYLVPVILVVDLAIAYATGT